MEEGVSTLDTQNHTYSSDGSIYIDIDLNWSNVQGDYLTVNYEDLTLSNGEATKTLTLVDSNGNSYGGAAQDLAVSALALDATAVDIQTAIDSRAPTLEFKQITNLVVDEELENSITLFEESISMFDEQYFIDQTILIGYTPIVNFDALSYGDLVEALSMEPVIYSETELGVNLFYHDEGLSFLIENQQGAYGSLQLTSQQQENTIDDVTTGALDNFNIVGANTHSESVQHADFATMTLANGFNTYDHQLQWVYTLDMEGLDAIALSPDEINIDEFTIYISNGSEVEIQQVSIDIGEASQVFNLIGQDDNLVTNFNVDVDTLSIVANGDVNQSGDFTSDYTVAVDIV